MSDEQNETAAAVRPVGCSAELGQQYRFRRVPGAVSLREDAETGSVYALERTAHGQTGLRLLGWTEIFSVLEALVEP